jgi:hypothetical protein
MKTILSSISDLSNMWNKNLGVTMTLSLFITLNLLISYHYASAQVNETGNNVNNITSPIFTPNNNFTSGTSSNTTGIMENTSGMIDDAFDALKDSFGSFFGK